LDFGEATLDDWQSARRRLHGLESVPTVQRVSVAEDRFANRVLVVFVHLEGDQLDDYLHHATHTNVADWLRSAGVTASKFDVSADAVANISPSEQS
jgi:hypothetical protein